MEQELLVIQVALDAPHHGVADRTALAQLEQLPPLGSEQLARQALEGNGLGLERSIDRTRRVALPMAGAMARARARRGQRRGGPAPARRGLPYPRPRRPRRPD